MCSVGWEEQERGAWRLWDGGSGLVIAKYVTAFHEPARTQQWHADETGLHASLQRFHEASTQMAIVLHSLVAFSLTLAIRE
jgi:hypothetical protein